MERGYYSEKDAADAVRQICCALEVSVEECNDFIVLCFLIECHKEI